MSAPLLRAPRDRLEGWLAGRAAALLGGLLAALLAALLVLGHGVASAAQLEIAPVTHELTNGRNALAMTLVNRGDKSVALQVRGFAWSQPEGDDVLVPAPELLLSPAIFELAPGRSQVLRALLRAPAVTSGERTYRLLIDELPEPGATEQIRLTLRISVPVFVQAAARAPADVQWRWSITEGTLVAVNRGGSRDRLREMQLVARDGTRIDVADAASPYLLAGATRRWSLGPHTSKPGDALTLRVTTDAGRIEVPLVVAP